MELSQIIKSIERRSGNYVDSVGRVFLLPSNLEHLPEKIENCNKLESVLITPFLITKDGQFYELYLYEFLLEVCEVPEAYFADYAQGNQLASEIIENIRPKAFIPNEDRDFFADAIRNYLSSMRKMVFAYDRQRKPELNESSLFYQIY